ncbi:MAG: universal stress protein [Bacteroidales bacterium]|jgi:nucleotide-binding universal stress UspA family protein|nr:universal stress protein [Bacteroidales bacterium]MDD4214705.1 universal stress protein [Bacteroidales bacterium]
MENKQLILVPTDFSEVCDNAITYGAKLAKLLGFNLALLHIIDKKTKAELKKEKQGIIEVSEKLDKIAKTMAKKYGIEVSAISEEGDIFTDIGKTVVRIKASLMILGTHGKVGLRQKFGVSFAKKVIATVPVPAIVVHNKTNLDKGFKDIVFPVSTTAEVRQKVRWTILIAKTFKSKIHLFQLNQSGEEDKKIMQNYIKQITKEFDKEDIKYVHVLADKKISYAKQVQDYAHEVKADLITIMITTDALNFKFGTYDEKMMFNAYEIPVMCINPVKTKIEYWK